MVGVIERTDVDIIQALDFEARVDCSEPAGCEAEAKWVVSWLCGCTRPYCTPHRRMVEGFSDRGSVYCQRHGVKRGENRVILVVPLP